MFDIEKKTINKNNSFHFIRLFCCFLYSMDSLLLAGHWLFAAVLGLSFTASYLMKKIRL